MLVSYFGFDASCLLFLGGALFKALNAAGLVQSAVFAGVKGMRLAGYLHGRLRVFLTIKLRRLGRRDSGANEELRARGEVVEDNRAVTRWMDTLFHPVKNTLFPRLLQMNAALRIL